MLTRIVSKQLHADYWSQKLQASGIFVKNAQATRLVPKQSNGNVWQIICACDKRPSSADMTAENHMPRADHVQRIIVISAVICEKRSEFNIFT